MTKAILISIQPQHVLNILIGKKTLELRKNIPKDFNGWVHVYVTKGKSLLTYDVFDFESGWVLYNTEEEFYSDHAFHVNSSIVARFWLDQIEDITEEEYMISWDDLSSIRIMTDTLNEQEILEKSCLSIDQIYQYWNLGNLYGWHIKKLEIYDKPKKLVNYIIPHTSRTIDNCKTLLYLPLQKAPQSWMYVWINE